MRTIRFRYSTFAFGEDDIHLRALRDTQEFADDSGEADRLGINSSVWPHFGVVWACGEVLARLMHGYDVEGRRILEVGCGIGLATLVLMQRRADVTATDHHPEAGAFLRYNAALNGLTSPRFVRAGWADGADALGTFDLIIGSDLLYDATCVVLLADFMDRHAAPACEILVVDPGRGNEGRFRRRLLALGYAHAGSEAARAGDVVGGKARLHRYARECRPPPVRAGRLPRAR
jgi:predicted nicotinamide N-methyase